MSTGPNRFGGRRFTAVSKIKDGCELKITPLERIERASRIECPERDHSDELISATPTSVECINKIIKFTVLVECLREEIVVPPALSGMTDKTFSELLAVVGMANETNALVGGYQVPTGQPRDL